MGTILSWLQLIEVQLLFLRIRTVKCQFFMVATVLKSKKSKSNNRHQKTSRFG